MPKPRIALRSIRATRLFSMTFNTVFAFMMAVAIYQVGMALGAG
ncbi:MAG: hypothetical protein ACYDBT_09470 [Desulfobulbaceae bacterium]